MVPAVVVVQSGCWKEGRPFAYGGRCGEVDSLEYLRRGALAGKVPFWTAGGPLGPLGWGWLDGKVGIPADPERRRGSRRRRSCRISPHIG